MTRTVLGFRLSTKYPPPPINAKRKIVRAKRAAAKRPPAARVYPFPEMNVGESCFISGKNRDAISAAAAHYRDRSFAIRAATNRGTDGYRVWRVQ